MASEEVSKLNSYSVMINISSWSSKVNAYAVLTTNISESVSKINAYAVLLSVPINLAGNLGGASQYG
jgi:hypothetical protein